MSVKIKKKYSFYTVFVILLTIIFFASCKTQQNFSKTVAGKRIYIDSSLVDKPNYEAYIAPYREHINKDLDSILAYCPVTLEKSVGKWQTNIGNFLAAETFALGNILFQQRENKSIDFCMLNNGGIRSIIPKGNVTTRTAYEVMPFENSLYVVGLSAVEVEQLANYMLTEKKPHPLYGIKLFITKDLQLKRIEINGKLLDKNKIYYVATSDYLSNGGDKMVFFRDSKIKYDLNYKLRNLLIDTFQQKDTLQNDVSERVILE